MPPKEDKITMVDAGAFLEAMIAQGMLPSSSKKASELTADDITEPVRKCAMKVLASVHGVSSLSLMAVPLEFSAPKFLVSLEVSFPLYLLHKRCWEPGQLEKLELLTPASRAGSRLKMLVDELVRLVHSKTALEVTAGLRVTLEDELAEYANFFALKILQEYNRFFKPKPADGAGGGGDGDDDRAVEQPKPDEDEVATAMRNVLRSPMLKMLKAVELLGEMAERLLDVNVRSTEAELDRAADMSLVSVLRETRVTRRLDAVERHRARLQAEDDQEHPPTQPAFVGNGAEPEGSRLQFLEVVGSSVKEAVGNAMKKHRSEQANPRGPKKCNKQKCSARTLPSGMTFEQHNQKYHPKKKI